MEGCIVNCTAAEQLGRLESKLGIGLAKLYEPDATFLRNVLGRRWLPAVGKPSMGAAQSGVPRERQFVPVRHENAKAIIRSLLGRLHEERRLGQVGPSREGLHLSIGEAIRIVHDRDRVPQRWGFGKYVHLRKRALLRHFLAIWIHRAQQTTQ